MNIAKQLRTLQKATGWSQEQLAAQLEVSFATLNSWFNERSIPRVKSKQKIENLYLNVIGADMVAEADLEQAKKSALGLKADTHSIVSNPAQLDALVLHLTYHTNTIEGSTMTLSDVADVLFDHKVLSDRTAIEQAEARNHQATLLWLMQQLVEKGKQLQIDAALIMNIHLRLMNGIISDAGEYRRHSVRIQGANVPLANWQVVADRIDTLTQTLNGTSSDIIATLAKTHAEFEQIHPFSDGNGRTGRLILLVQALQAGLLPPVVVKERKFAYYKYLRNAQIRQNYASLELFIAQSMQFAEDLLSSLSR
jgi:Fic family protein/DNA-binding XRE family transcriptional regulator